MHAARPASSYQRMSNPKFVLGGFQTDVGIFVEKQKSDFVKYVF